MSGIDSRRHKRYRVHLRARFEVATEFISQYAENLSYGGLFIRGAHELEKLQVVPVQLDLPGFGRFDLEARVAFVLDEDGAQASGRNPGAGLEIVDRPPGFENALSEYLLRLGKRRDNAVYTDSQMLRAALEGAGYRARMLPGADALISELARSNLPVIGIAINERNVPQYEHLPAAAELFRVYKSEDDFDRILGELDGAE